ncbi:MAG: cadherin-like domain-containing protein, partial [Pirellulaceae bacterium]|nr:cadherin-like domain-containing protein [Pirellulaceae bacterium]
MSRKTHNSRKPTHQQTRRAFFESLEGRLMLAVLPVANHDPLYSTAMNTQLTSSTTVIANDLEVESQAYTASVVSNPPNGTLNSFNTTTGQFSYTPTTNFVGIDTFVYKINNGTYDSNHAIVSISVGGVFGPRTNLDDQPLDSPLMTGANTVVQDLSLGQRLIYRSDTVSLKPVIVVETSLKSGAAVPNSIDAVLTFGGTGQGTVSYTNTGLAAGDTLRFALQADATALATGYYAWSMTVTAVYTGSTSSTTYSGYHAVVNRASSTFGNGWWLDGLDQLVVSGSGALLVRGNGDTLWYSDNGGGYDKAAGDTQFSTLVENGGGDFTLTSKHGMESNFSSSGLLTAIEDANANAWDFTYTDGDGDTVADEIDIIEEPYGRDHDFAYSSNKVSTFTDYASHVSTFGYSTGKLTSLTLSDPDAGGALAAPVWGNAYNATTGLLETRTDPNAEDTDYTYDSTSLRLSRVDTPISGQYTTLVPVQTYGLKTGAGNT